MLFQLMPTNELPTIFLGKKIAKQTFASLKCVSRRLVKQKKPEPKMVIAGKTAKPSYL